MMGRAENNPQERRSSPLLPWRWPLHWQILAGLALGIGLGYVSGMTAVRAAEAGGDPMGAAKIITDRWDYLVYDLVGDVFLNALKLIIVPLVASSIVLAIASIGDRGGFGRLGLKTLGYYLSTSLIAVLIGLTLVNAIGPGTSGGAGILEDPTLAEAFRDSQLEAASRGEGRSATSFLDVFRAMVPDNVFAAASDNGSLLGLIVVSLLVGYFVVRLSEQARDTLLSFTQAVYELTLRVTDLVLGLAPIGVCFLVAGTTAVQIARLVPDQGVSQLITGIAWFGAAVLGSLLLHFFVVMPLILCLVARVNPVRHYRAMLPALLTAFSTASSSATLPVTIECVEDRAGVSNRTAGFVLPLGATVNMDGTALYECVASIFICQAFGIHLTFGQQFFIVVVALLTSIGVAGVPSASIVAIIVILQAISAQVDFDLVAAGGLGLIFLIDRPLDMCRTAVNIFSDSVGAVVVARTEGETGVLSR